MNRPIILSTATDATQKTQSLRMDASLSRRRERREERPDDVRWESFWTSRSLTCPNNKLSSKISFEGCNIFVHAQCSDCSMRFVDLCECESMRCDEVASHRIDSYFSKKFDLFSHRFLLFC